jgi:hypothetical protein
MLRSNRFRPTFEALETRDCPTTGGLAGVATSVVYPRPVICPVIAPYFQFALQETPNERFVDHLYQDLYHTTPTVDTITRLGTQLDHRQVSYVEVARQFTFSQTYGMTVVHDLFWSMLHRDYNAATDQQSGLTDAVNGYLTTLSREMSNPTAPWSPQYATSRDALAAAIAGTQEYHNTRGGGTGTGWFTALYMDALHRAPTQAELNGYHPDPNYLLSGSDYWTALAVFSGTEHRQLEVNDFYQHFLHRSADPQGSTFWVGRLQAGIPVEEVIAEMVSQPEYIRIAQS